MTLDEQILINQFGQGLVDENLMKGQFLDFDLLKKRGYLKNLSYLIKQSKADNCDIKPAIKLSGLKNTYTPCVLLQKGLTQNNLNRLIDLPENELQKVFILFLSVFKLSYQRRFEVEKNDPNKWWYWDLSDIKKVHSIKSLH